MSIGPGKYDEALTKARRLCGARAALLVVFDGKSGPGFSCQADMASLLMVPAMLRRIADGMEEDIKSGKGLL